MEVCLVESDPNHLKNKTCNSYLVRTEEAELQLGVNMTLLVENDGNCISISFEGSADGAIIFLNLIYPHLPR